MRPIFFSEYLKFHVDSKRLSEITQKVYGLLDKLI